MQQNILPCDIFFPEQQDQQEGEQQRLLSADHDDGKRQQPEIGLCAISHQQGEQMPASDDGGSKSEDTAGITVFPVSDVSERLKEQ